MKKHILNNYKSMYNLENSYKNGESIVTKSVEASDEDSFSMSDSTKLCPTTVTLTSYCFSTYSCMYIGVNEISSSQ